jgi:hypothetical protein
MTKAMGFWLANQAVFDRIWLEYDTEHDRF